MTQGAPLKGRSAKGLAVESPKVRFGIGELNVDSRTRHLERSLDSRAKLGGKPSRRSRAHAPDAFDLYVTGRFGGSSERHPRLGNQASHHIAFWLSQDFGDGLGHVLEKIVGIGCRQWFG